MSPHLVEGGHNYRFFISRCLYSDRVIFSGSHLKSHIVIVVNKRAINVFIISKYHEDLAKVNHKHFSHSMHMGTYKDCHNIYIRGYNPGKNDQTWFIKDFRDIDSIYMNFTKIRLCCYAALKLLVFSCNGNQSSEETRLKCTPLPQAWYRQDFVEIILQAAKMWLFDSTDRWQYTRYNGQMAVL